MSDTDPRDAPSILDAIQARGVEPSRVQLKELEDDAPPELAEVKLRRRGRYDVEGQIAEGGVGHILKAHDADLNRDVALKMLREEHVEDPDLIRRFVEEAQIGGQLQHPGVVPVYELGLGEDRRPYFAMKLVKGRTLAALLADRKDPSEDRRRDLAVFLSACQTVGYAHSRGVIHRDLKSSNIMIGAFGEVQVVDWGFAKVLAQGGVADERRARKQAAELTRIATVRSGSVGSESIAGSILGTIAYMPPEQALGQVDDMDERSDVFSLGAVLCEILTGAPPYTAKGNERLKQAMEATLDDAFARLDASGADPGIVKITKRCLAPLRRDRPRDAGVLARALSRYLAMAEERERKSEIAAAEARRDAAWVAAEATEERARAEQAKAKAAKQRAKLERNRGRAERAREVAKEARRGRRRTLLVAGVALLVVLVAGVVTVSILGGRADHARRTEGRVDALLERAKVLEGGKRFDESLAVLDQAASVARSEGVADTALPRVTVVRAEVVGAQEQAIAAQAREEADDRLVERLEQVRLGAPTPEAIAAALLEFGIDPEGEHAVERIPADPAAAEEVAAALDEWAWHRPRGPARDRLLALAREADPDEGRNRLRWAMGSENVRTLLDVAESDVETPLPVRTADLLGIGLLASAQVEKAYDFLRRAQHRHPGSPWLQVRLANVLLRLPIPRCSDAWRHLEAAIALRPGIVSIKTRLEGLRRKGTDLDAFRARVGFRNTAEWFSFDVKWSRVTGRRRRIHFDKAAVTKALFDHRGGVQEKAAPMVYEADTFFVAETLDREGKLIQTEAIRIGWSKTDTAFFVFDEDGTRTNRFFRHREMAPRVCQSCHMAEPRGYYPPMMNFPDEPAESRVQIDDEFRHRNAVLTLYEGFHCGSNVFGPYGAIWLGKLRADAKEDRLSPTDMTHYARLREKYAHLLDE